MWKLGRKGRAAFVGAAAIAGATVLVGASPSATADGPVTVTQRYGTLTLELLDGTATVTLKKTDGSTTQGFTATNRCGLTVGGTLLQLTASGGQFDLGLNVNDIGVRAKNNCATDSGRVSGDESVTVSLGTDIPAGVEITRAELDIEGKKNADLGYRLDGGALSSSDLPRAASDNGPDAGIGDNSRVLVTQPAGFRSITLSAAGPTGTEISLNGGGDGTYPEYLADGLVEDEGDALDTAGTVFVLSFEKTYADDLFCTESRTATLIGGSAASATITRSPNDPAQDCEDIPITFEIRDEGVLLEKSVNGINTGEPQNVRAQVSIVWTPQTATMPMPPRQINLTPDNPATWTNVAWCTGQAPGGLWVHPANTPWCLISDTMTLLPNGKVAQTQVYDGAGDPMWR